MIPGGGLRPLNLAFYCGMRLIPYAAPRRVLADYFSRCVNAANPRPDLARPEHQHTRDSVEKGLQSDGCVLLDPLLTPAQIAEIRRYLDDKDANTRYGRAVLVQHSGAPAIASRTSYSLRTVLQCPHILELANRRDVLQLAADYLGCVPTISGMGIHWSLPSSATDVVNGFHRDPDDWRFVKLFVYLTDVDTDSGPHQYVIGSHRQSGRFLANHYTEADIRRRYGDGGVRTITGSRGTSFMADTWGIHRGVVAHLTPRLNFQVQYSIFPNLKTRYWPIQLDQAANVDPYVNRCLVASPSDPRDHPGALSTNNS